jgi:hypothetical protein
MNEPRAAAFPVIIPAGILLGALLGISVFLPIWRCASCDRATWQRVFPNTRISLWRDSPAECKFCGQTGRMSLLQRWNYLRILEKAGFRPRYPLIP